jgi:CubicO group peptidase (beta-lactamase class C family)
MPAIGLEVKSMCRQTIRFVLVLSVILCFITTISALPKDHGGAFSSQVDSLFAPWNKPDVPGAAVAITHKGQIIYKKCFGLANLEYKVPIKGKTVFNLASVSKQFTALAVLLLEHQGKLSLDDDIHDYFPELPDYDTKVSLRNLIHHTSGIWEYSTMFRYYEGFQSVDRISIKDVLALLEGQDQLLFEPGSQWKYCNTNYALLGEVATRVTGESLASWTKKHIFEPLKMKNTFFRDDCNQVIPNGASCYFKKGDIYERDPSNSEVVGPGYLYTTIDDMILWLDNFRLHAVGGDSLIARMFQKGRFNEGSENFYGYGLGVSEYDGKTVIDHSGQTNSFMAMMIYVREDEVGIAILANNRDVKAEKLAYEILDLFYGKKADEEEASDEAQTPEPEPFVSMDSIDTDGIGGAFLIRGSGGKLLVSCLTNGLYCIFDGFGSDIFYPLSDSSFMNIYRNVTFWLSFDDQHVPTGLVMDLKGDTIKADRISRPILSPEQLSADYVGTYYCDALDIAYHIIVDNGRLVIRHRRYDDRPLQPTDVDEFAGEIGIVRFFRDEEGIVERLYVSDEDTNFKPITFVKIRD